MSLESQTEVLEWLAEHHPELHMVAELDRDWLWLPVDLRGEKYKAVRESIGRRGAGFVFSPKGHKLPSGHIGTWGHSCNHPMPFRRRGYKPKQQTEPETELIRVTYSFHIKI